MITVELKRSCKIPLYLQLYQQIKERIVSGELSSGERLPSKRALAGHLKVSVITVENAYAQLLGEGYVRSRVGSGFYVEKLSFVPKKAIISTELSEKTSKAVELRYNYSTSGTDIDSFPFESWKKLFRAVLGESGTELLSPCPSAGTYRLRAAIAGYLSEFRGLRVSPQQIVVGAGSEYLTGLIIQLLGRERVYGIENPGYPKIAHIFKENGAKVRPMALDLAGLYPAEDLPEVLHITPGHHFPLGITMPAARRSELLARMKERAGYIIEDDYDSEFRYRGQIIPTLFESDGAERVIYIGSFTKLLAPSLRISFMVLPPHLMKLYDERLSFYACTVPVFDQLTLAAFIEGGYLERHINRMKKLYKKRRDCLLECFGHSTLAPYINLEGGDVGVHLLLTVRNGMTEKELIERAAASGILINGLSGYCFTPPKDDGAPPRLLLGFTGITEREIGESVKIFEKIWER